jgi:hypothetical protein
MLKNPASFVLGSSKSSTYPRGYDSGFDSSAALLTAFLSILRGILQLLRKSLPAKFRLAETVQDGI